MILTGEEQSMIDESYRDDYIYDMIEMGMSREEAKKMAEELLKPRERKIGEDEPF